MPWNSKFMQYAAAYNTCSVVYNKSLNDLKAVNGYQKRPNETMQLIMCIEFCPVWSKTGTFGRPEDNVRNSGTECPKPGLSRKNRDGWSAWTILPITAGTTLQSLTSSLSLDPRQEIGNIGEARRITGRSARENETVDAMLVPSVALFADQWTARVAEAYALHADHRPGV